MIFWYWYLLTAAALSFTGYITLDIFLMIALAVIVHLQFHFFASKNRIFTGFNAAVAAGGALALLWRESFLLPPSTLISFLANPKTRPSANYILEFTWQFVNLRMLASGAAIFAMVFFVHRRKPLLLALSAYVILASACIIMQPGRKIANMDLDGAQEEEYPADAEKYPLPGRVAATPVIVPLDPFYAKESFWAEESSRTLNMPSPQPIQDLADQDSSSPRAFYKQESGRIVEFDKPSEGSPPFDVIILHICSLSWKDIKDSGSDLIPFFSRFNYVFTNFSSACSYSGPAALRVLKSPCGQAPHPMLYDDAPADCYLMDKLRESGFKTYTMTTHNGQYGDFSINSQKYGHADASLGIEDLPVAYQMFSGSPMCSDDAALGKFWKARLDSKTQRAALYYNTANLHMGTHKPSVFFASDDVAAYKERLEETVTQLETFFSGIERSGRNAVVIFVPEHGAALVGTKMQAKDVRDIPLPPIVTVPVAVKLIGKSFYADSVKPRIITKPASFLAMAWIISEFLRHNPFTKDARKPDAIVSEIPGTGFMAEDENAAVMRLGSGYIYRLRGGKWTPLPDYAGIPPGIIPSPQDFRQPASR